MSTAHWQNNFRTNGRKCPTAKTKTVLQSVNKMEQLVGMSKSKREKIQNKNPPTMMGIYLANLGLSKTSRLCSLTNAVELITGNGHVFGISSKHVSKKVFY